MRSDESNFPSAGSRRGLPPGVKPRPKIEIQNMRDKSKQVLPPREAPTGATLSIPVFMELSSYSMLPEDIERIETAILSASRGNRGLFENVIDNLVNELQVLNEKFLSVDPFLDLARQKEIALEISSGAVALAVLWPAWNKGVSMDPPEGRAVIIS